MSRFDEVKENVSDFAETAKNKTEALVEHTKADYHEAKAKLAEDRADEIDKSFDRRDKLKQMAA